MSTIVVFKMARQSSLPIDKRVFSKCTRFKIISIFHFIYRAVKFCGDPRSCFGPHICEIS